MQVIANLRDIINHAVVTNVEVQNKVAEIDAEIDALALHRLTQYNENHTEKLTKYNNNDTLKMDQYNANHIERLENINYAYADRIVQMLKTKRIMGMVDEYVAQTEEHMIPFLSTDDDNYIYYGNGVLLVEGVDYTIYDTTTIELIVKANPYDVITQINTAVLGDMLAAEGVLFDYMIGQPNGVAGLNEVGQVPAEQLPSYVDDVLEFPTYADLPAEGETGKIYIVVTDETSGEDTSSYRWTGTVYAMVSNTLTAADIKALNESNANTNEYSDAEKLKVGHISVTQAVDLDAIESRQGTVELDTVATNLSEAVNEVHEELDSHKASTGEDHTFIDQDVTTTATPMFAGVVTEGLVDGRDVSVDGAKLDTIEENAKDDQTGTEIKALYEAELDTNAYTDASVTKLDVNTALSTTATTLPTAINELKTAVDLNTAKQTNVTTNLSYTAGVNEGTVVSSDGTDAVIPVADATNAGLMLAAEKTKLNGIETEATADQIASEVPVTPQGNLSSSNVQSALVELQTDIDGLTTIVEW